MSGISKIGLAAFDYRYDAYCRKYILQYINVWFTHVGPREINIILNLAFIVGRQKKV